MSSIPATRPSLPIKADLHTHTFYSHGQASVRTMYEAGYGKGLAVIGFSEHSPRPAGYRYPADYQEHLNANFRRYIADVQSIREQGEEDGVQVLLGLEVDYIPGQEAFAASLIQEYPFDYIIGGLHFQETWGFDAETSDWDKLDRERLFAVYERYYADLARMCRTGLFHIAAHPDLIKIFTVDAFHDWLKDRTAQNRVYETLAAMRENNVLMEVSSAGLRKACKEIYPCPALMRMAAELQLPICFGSDAHCPRTPAFAFDALARYAAEFGYAESFYVAGGARQRLPLSTPGLFAP